MAAPHTVENPSSSEALERFYALANENVDESREVAEELTHSAWASVKESSNGDFEEDGYKRISLLIRTKAATNVRTRKRASERGNRVSEEALENEKASAEWAQPESRIQRKETHELLLKEIQRLAWPENEVLRLRALENKSFRYIAKTLDLNSGRSASMHYKRALETLKARLTDKYDDSNSPFWALPPIAFLSSSLTALKSRFEGWADQWKIGLVGLIALVLGLVGYLVLDSDSSSGDDLFTGFSNDVSDAQSDQSQGISVLFGEEHSTHVHVHHRSGSTPAGRESDSGMARSLMALSSKSVESTNDSEFRTSPNAGADTGTVDVIRKKLFNPMTGKLRDISERLADDPEVAYGRQVSYHPNGKEMTVYYLNHHGRHGPAISYDEQGNERKREYYYYGQRSDLPVDAPKTKVVR